MLASSLRLSALAACAAAALGCGGASTETVSGKVTLDNAPLAGAYVSAGYKDLTAKGGPFVGKTDDQGVFSLGPIGKPGGGVPAGDYSLTITTTHSDTADENTPPPAERVPAPYPTGVDFTVPDGGTTEANFDLKSK